MTADVATIAGELYDACETKTRGDGTPYVSSTDDRVVEIARAAHGGDSSWHLPCDWHWLMTRHALGAIHDGELTDDDDVHEWADREVDTYNQARREWLAVCGQYDEDEAAELIAGSDEAGSVNVLLGIAQYVELRSIAYAVLEGVRELAEAADDEEGGES